MQDFLLQQKTPINRQGKRWQMMLVTELQAKNIKEERQRHVPDSYIFGK